MEEPNYQIVRNKILSLIDGSGSRLEIENWARKFVGMDDPPEMTKAISKAIDRLAICEERDDGPDSRYSYGREDFEDWLAALDAGS